MGKVEANLTRSKLSDGTSDHVVHPAQNKHWLVAYVGTNREKKTSELLTKMGIVHYLPIQKEVHQWSDRKKTIERVLIPSMIFVYVDTTQRKEVLNLSSVSRYMVMRGESAPAVIPEKQMERFKFMVAHSQDNVSICDCSLRSGDMVRVTHGPLAGLIGELVLVEGKQKVAVRVNMLGCACVDINIDNIERIDDANQSKDL